MVASSLSQRDEELTWGCGSVGIKLSHYELHFHKELSQNKTCPNKYSSFSKKAQRSGKEKLIQGKLCPYPASHIVMCLSLSRS